MPRARPGHSGQPGMPRLTGISVKSPAQESLKKEDFSKNEIKNSFHFFIFLFASLGELC
jgi:hypothetical protein